ncbi:MAG: AAA family ATPase [Acidobacteriota bacterium]
MSVLEHADDVRAELELLIRARYPLVWLVTHEEERAERLLRAAAEATSRDLITWRLSEGFAGAAATDLVEEQDAKKKDGKDESGKPSPLEDAFRRVRRGSGRRVYVFEDVHALLEDPRTVRCLKDTVQSLRSTHASVVLLGPVLSIPSELEKLATVVDLPLPTAGELRTLLDELLASLPGGRVTIEADESVLERAAHAARGLTEAEAESVFSKALVRDPVFDADDLSVIIEEKKQVLRKTGLLEYHDRTETIQGVGGFAGLKTWLSERADTFSERAREYGLPAPRGVLLLGVQGCGKSLTAKAVASEWGLPLLRLDVGRLFDSFVGKSEANMRQAILVAESLAPAVLWIDELEKGLAGVRSSGGDSGVTARVFGSLLTWLQEKTAPVFVVATSNDVRSLPPELLRKGRFDEIFFVDLPGETERAAIFEIHLRKRRRDPARFDLASLARATDGWSGSEIEEAVVSALFSTFPQGRDVTTEDVLTACAATVPLSRTMANEVNELREWAKNRTRPAG